MTYVAVISICLDLPEARNYTEAKIYARNIRDKILQESEKPLITCDVEDVYDIPEEEYEL